MKVRRLILGTMAAMLVVGVATRHNWAEVKAQVYCHLEYPGPWEVYESPVPLCLDDMRALNKLSVPVRVYSRQTYKDLALYSRNKNGHLWTVEVNGHVSIGDDLVGDVEDDQKDLDEAARKYACYDGKCESLSRNDLAKLRRDIHVKHGVWML